MKTYLQTLTDAEEAILTEAIGTRERCATVAGWLWRIKEFRDAAERLGIDKRTATRRKRGRPCVK